MKYFDTADVKVILDSPAIDTGPRPQYFDIGAQNWDVLHKSPLFDSVLVEEVHDDNGGFAAIFPSKRKWYIDNYMDGSPSLTCVTANASATSIAPKPYITWKPIDSSIITGVFKNVAKDYLPYSIADVPVNRTTGISDGWVGPIWKDNQLLQEAIPNDLPQINAFLTAVGVNQTLADQCIAAASAPVTTACAPIDTTNWVLQSNVKSGMWWGLTSSPFLQTNMPFFVTFKKKLPPTSATHATHFVISFGKNDPDNHFDIWVSANMKPRIIDYKMFDEDTGKSKGSNGSNGSGGNSDGNGTLTAGIGLEFLPDQSRVLSSDNDVEIGVMVIAGRLAVWVNGYSYIYTRTKKDSENGPTTLLECKIPAGSIDIYGTNVQTSINTCPMTFSPLGMFVLPIPKTVNESNRATGGAIITTRWTAIKADGNADENGSVAKIASADGRTTYGVDCRLFLGDCGTDSPDGVGDVYHKQGIVYLAKSGSNFTSPALSGVDFYFMAMNCENSIMGGYGGTVCNNGVPYFFRVRGMRHRNTTDVKHTEYNDISDKIISIDETATAPDYFHIKRSLSIIAYDPDMSLVALNGKQTGITLIFQGKKTFRGLVTNVTRSKIAGKETCILNCEDYIYVLNGVQVINSPFYDGMVAKAAIKDLAKKAGFNSVIVDWTDGDDFFLPSGYAFSRPAVKFQPRQSIFECIIGIARRFECFIYFDGEGQLHLSKLPGGLFSVSDGSTVVPFQSTDPNGLNPIIGEKNITYNFDSTVETISVWTVDRDTRNAIMYAKSAGNEVLAFNKTWLYDQPSFGELDAVKAWVADAAKRMFKAILKCSFKTVGQNSGNLMPFDFITVDGESFRLMSVKRNFNADNNEVISAYEGEWKGG
jgi:hypothetical protein